MRRILLYILISALVIVFFMSNRLLLTNTRQKISLVPDLLYWAWEAPQDMTGIDPDKSGIAELAASIYIKANRSFYHLRQQPLRAPENIYRIAVIHIEARPRWKPLLDQQMANIIAMKIKNIYGKKSYNALQIDFEASVVQRAFYQKLLLAIRKRMGRELFISITGLASWCTSDGWIGRANLPVDLVVPMYFSLGFDAGQRQAFINHFPGTINRLAPECQSAIGLATFEKWQLPLRAHVPVFVFTKGPWNAQTLQQAKQLAFTIQH